MKIAIIGCGAAAKRYYVPALRKYPEVVRNLYLVDRNPDQARSLALDFGGGTVVADHREIIGKVDGAIIIVPHFYHHAIALDLLKAGIHVLCEKPLAETVREVEELNAAADASGAVLCLNNTRRMFPSFRAVRDEIAAGTIGKLRSITYNEGNTFEWQSATGFYVNPRVSSKGVLLDVGSHVADTICWWLGEKPVVLRCQDDSFGGPESVSRVEATAKGCSVNILLNRLSVLDNRFEVKGESGSISGGLFDWQEITIRMSQGKTVTKKVGPVFKTYPEFVMPIVDNFLEVIEKKAKPLVSGGDVKDSIALLEECYAKRERFRLPWYEVSKKTVQNAGKTLVTGSTGFLGGRIVELLHLTGERSVRAGIRQWSSAARLGRLPVDIVQMDLLDPTAIAKALDGVTEIIHCAKGGGGATETGTRNLLAEAQRRGIRRFVHISTADVYGEVTGVVREDAPFIYSGTEYNRTKVDAEKACWEYHAKGLPVTVMRPSIIYGPFSKGWSIRYAAMFLAGKGALYEKIGEGKCNLVFVDDLVKAILLSLDKEDAVGNAFNIVGPDIVTWNEYFKQYNDMMGLPPLPVLDTTRAGMKTYLMQPVRYLGGIVRDHFMGPVKKVAETFDLAKKLMKQTELRLKMTPSPDEFRLFSREVRFPGDKARDMLEFRPSCSLDAGLQTTVEWLNEQGYFLGRERQSAKRASSTVRIEKAIE